jgi:hypothetical protein
VSRYYAFSRYIKEKFHKEIHKVVVDIGFNCPNRDGTKGIDGCTFCNNQAFSPAHKNRGMGIEEQIQIGIDNLKKRYKRDFDLIVYFQPFSNTYGDIDYLEQCIAKAIKFPGCAGIAIGTRADCINDEVLAVCRKYSAQTDFWIELGLETIHDETLRKINRGHNFQEFLDGYKRLKTVEGIKICLHLIHGLPEEDLGMMLATVRKVNELKPDAIKFHQLEIVRNTKLEKDFLANQVKVLTIREYMDVLAKSLELIAPSIMVQRLFGFTPNKYLVAPFVENPLNLKTQFEKYLEENNINQGALYENP